jgi:hypothetical protein
MQRSGGIAGRPMGHLSIVDLENLVAKADGNWDELTLVLAELGYRKTKRANELRDLTSRVLDERYRKDARDIGPLFE